ncbi:hypothetical protein [Stenotrophomonas pigmentata]|uniref:hypothetical protein n=1 Tax=Stenotrophomonas pigmentata TaxID=3055080 RepID=UPI0026F0455B|nr:hypothetical protein [Stenotrophomonas sp. 610A2]
MPVTSVTELINLLAARRQTSILHDRRTGMPYSWSNWLRTRVSKGLSAFVDVDAAGVMAARTPRPRDAAAAPLPLWRIIVLLFWNGGDPPPRDQRGLRWFAGFFSAGLHVLFALLLLWVALVRSNVPEQNAEEGERVQVEFIGDGTAQDEGGGAPDAEAGAAGAAAAEPAAGAAPTPASLPAASAAAASIEQQAEQPPAAQAMQEVPALPEPVTSEPAPPVEQPLQVTETTRPTTDFIVPPVAVAAPTLRTRETQVRERTVETAVDRPQPTPSVRQPTEIAVQLRPSQVQVRERQIEVAEQQSVTLPQARVREAQVQVRTPQLGVRERQIETVPQESVAMAALPTRDAEVQVRTPTTAVRERSVAGVPDKPATSASTAPAAAQASASTAQASASTNAAPAAGQAAAANPSPRPGTSPGAGPKPVDRSGGWAAPTRGDDWGASQRQVAGSAGGQAEKGAGLFNADGSVKLGGNEGQSQDAAKRGAPGGDTDTWSRERIAESGTWLKRPPYGFTPTSFDKYWAPNESLLAEWVRRGIKSVEIPIPGSNSKISCVVSMLQFGGGCGLTNPNMQEQPAEARPPPDIPFKKELQEDNGSR